MPKNGKSKPFALRRIEARKLKDDKTLRAFEKAHEVRKFEIDLYWRRTAYFWAIIAAIFAGFFLMASKGDGSVSKHHNLYLCLIAITGFVFSYAWFLVNKGSKFWQENWEYHIDALEDDITGPLYKTVLYRQSNLKDDKTKTLNEHVFSPQNISVSKVNQSVALTTMVVWAALMLSVTQGLITTILSACMLVYISRQMYVHCRSELSTNEKPTIIKSHLRATKLED